MYKPFFSQALEGKQGHNIVINIFHINVQSIRNKLLELELVAHDNNVVFICINEHWLNDNELNGVSLDNFDLIAKFCRVDKIHGGVCIFARQGFPCSPINFDDLTQEVDFEVAGLRYKNYHIITIYRSPSGDFDRFITLLSKLLDRLFGLTVVIGGDFNVKFNTLDPHAVRLCDIFESYGMSFFNDCTNAHGEIIVLTIFFLI